MGQDLPVLPTKYHSCAFKKTDKASLLDLPGHAEGQGQGFGHFGGKKADLNVLWPLLKNVESVRNFIEAMEIPPQKGEAMVPQGSYFWNQLWNKYEGEGINRTSSEWPLFHRDGTIHTYHNVLNDTLINIKTIGNDDIREELKQACLYVMVELKELIVDAKTKKCNADFWRYTHEILAARHFYQIYLLDDRILID